MRLLLCLGLAFLAPFLSFLRAADSTNTTKPVAPVVMDPHVEEVLNATTQYFAGLKSFEVDVTSNTHMEMPNMKNDMGTSFHVALEQPNSFALLMKAGMMGGTLISDGKTWITYQPMFNKYTSVDAPATLDELLSPVNLALVEGGFPLGIETFLGKDPLKQLKTGLKTSSYVGLEKIAETPAHHLHLVAGVYTTDLWIAEGAEPRLLQTVVTPDLSSSMKGMTEDMKKKMPAGFDSMKMTRTTQFINWQVNQPVAAATFQFTPPLGATLVDEFIPQPVNPLVGKMAPDFKLNDLDGHPVQLSDLRGKIVVLDFWATWCGPCVASLPAVVKITSALKDKDVVFYAVNLKETEGQVKKFQADKTWAFPVLLDAQGHAADLYNAKSIPESVLIDKTGTIQAVHVGYDPGLQKKLTRELTTLVAGQSLIPVIPAAPATPGEK